MRYVCCTKCGARRTANSIQQICICIECGNTTFKKERKEDTENERIQTSPNNK